MAADAPAAPAAPPPTRTKCSLCRGFLPHAAPKVAVSTLITVANLGLGNADGNELLDLHACLDCAEAWASSPEAERIRSVARAALVDFAVGQQSRKGRR